MHGPDVAWRARAIAERGADFSDQRRQVRLDDEGVRPETLLKVRLGNDFRPLRDQRLQQQVRLRREMNLFAVTEELSGIEVERARAERNSHDLPTSRAA